MAAEKSAESAELNAPLHDQIVRLSEAGERDLDAERLGDARNKFFLAFSLIPEPKSQFEAGTWLAVAIGDVYFLERRYGDALHWFRRVLAEEYYGARENPFVWLRRGQCYLELGDEESARQDLVGAYLMEGDDLFSDEDPKYKLAVQSWIRGRDNNSP